LILTCRLKNIFRFLLFFLLAGIIAGCSNPAAEETTGVGSSLSASGSSHETTSPPSGNISIKMLNIGQGDAILIKTSEQTILIDTGDIESDSQAMLRKELDKNHIKKIDKVILSHPHADHIGGMEVLLSGAYQVGTIYDNGMLSKSKIYLNYRNKAKALGIEHKTLKAGDVLDFGNGASFKVLWPTASLQEQGKIKGYESSPNNESIVGKLIFGSFSMLFTGDVEQEAEAQILKNYSAALKSTILKSPHHGSKTSSSLSFLNAVHPEACLISCGAGNKYGHPHEVTLNKYQKIHAKVFITKDQGTISILSDGKKYEIKGDN
jgi:competence protein ComEC